MTEKSPSAEQILSAAATVRIWDAEKYLQIADIESNSSPLEGNLYGEFSPDGRRIVAPFDNTNARISAVLALSRLVFILGK